MNNSVLKNHNRRALIGGILATIITLIGPYVLGHISGYEAKVLIKSSLDGINTLCNTIVLASATILALLLTVLSISTDSSSQLKKDHYKNVLTIAKLDTMVFIVAMIAFLLLNIPVTESKEIPIHYFTIIYYVSIALASLLSGGLIAVVLMLYGTVHSIIQIVGLGRSDHPLLFQKEVEEEKEVKEEMEKEQQEDGNKEKGSSEKGTSPL